MRLIVALCVCVALCGCLRPDVEMKVETGSQRVKVKRIGVFKDSLAYGEYRGIYVIEDTKTGKEFVGVSGVGVSELGTHGAGTKESPRHSDER